MKLVFEHIDFTTVGHLQSMVEAAGIRTEIRNLGNSSLAGEVPFTQVFPELWVLNDDDEPRARAIIRDYRSEAKNPPGAPLEDWSCPVCGEISPGTFGECWSCSAPAPCPE